MALVFDRASQGTGGSTTTVSYSVTCSGTDRLMLAFIGYGGSPLRSITTITYGGIAMTALPGGSVHDGTSRGMIVYYLINPKVGDNVFTVTLSASTFQVAAGVIFYMGAHQTAPFGTVLSDFNAATNTPAITLPTTTGRVAIAGVLSDSNTSMSITGGTSRMAINNFGGFCYDIGTIDGGGTLSWSYAGADPGWAIVGVDIKPSDVLDASQGDAFRFYPRSGQEGRMLGAVIEGTSDGDPVTGPYITLATTPTAGNLALQYYQMTGLNLGTYRYLRCRLGAGCYGNVSEIEFYKAGAKITGTGYGSPGSFGGSGATFDKALDGNTATFFDGPNPDNQYIGIDQGGPAQDSFNRPDSSDIGTNWTVVPSSNLMKLVSNAIQPISVTVACCEYWNVDTFNDNQWAEIRVLSVAGGGVNLTVGPGVALRASTTANTYYRFLVNNGSNGLSLSKMIAGTFTLLMRYFATPTLPAILRFEVEGNILRGYVNGLLYFGISDLSIPTGNRAGVCFGTNASLTNVNSDDWKAGSLSRSDVRSVMVGAEAAGNSGNITLVAPAGSQNDDIWIASIMSFDNVAHGLSGWTQIAQANGDASTRLSSWWFRYAGTAPNLVVTHAAGGQIVGGITCVRGAKKTGSPLNAVGAMGSATGGSPTTAPAITTTVANCLIIGVGGGKNANTSVSYSSSLGGVVTLLEDASDTSNPQAAYFFGSATIGMYECPLPAAGTTNTAQFGANGGAGSTAFQMAIEPVTAVAVAGVFRNRVASRGGLGKHYRGIGNSV